MDNNTENFWNDKQAPEPVTTASVAGRSQETNTFALLSMILGVCGIFFSVIASIPAVILGHIALRKMKLTGQPGRNFALTGLWLGYAKIGIDIVLIALFLLFFAGAFFAAIAAGSNPDYLGSM